MPRFGKTFRLLLLLFLLVFASLHFLSVSVEKKRTGGKQFSTLDKTILAIYQPMEQVVSWPFRQVISVWHGYVALVGVQEENDKLKLTIEEMKGQLVELGELRQEASELKEYFEYNERLLTTMSTARVVGRSFLPEVHTVLINRGSSQGLTPSMVALTPAGIAGHLTATGGSVSRVRLITDPLSAVPVVVQRSRSAGVVKGSSDGVCRLLYIKWTEDVAEGDLLVTSGHGIFPEGLAVGTISKIHHPEPGALVEMIVEPQVDMSKLEILALVLPNPYKEVASEFEEFVPAVQEEAQP